MTPPPRTDWALKQRELPQGPMTFLESGRGAPVLFLHGLNGNARSWAPQLTGLSDRFRVLAWNAPGYNGSARVGDDIMDFARAGLALVAALFEEPISIVGHSMGGVVAMQMVALEPKRFSRAVFSGTHPGNGAADSAVAEQRYSRRLREYQTLSHEEYGLRRARAMLAPTSAADVVNAIAAIAAEISLEGMQAAAKAITTCDLRPALPSITIPSLVLTCDLDRVVPQEKSAPLLDLLPNRRHIHLPGLAHAPYYESPQLFNETITSFLSEDTRNGNQ